MRRVVLVDPLAVIDGRKALFLRDNFGGEVPLSCPYPPLELAFTASVLRDAGVPVELIAANVLGIHHDALAKRLAADPPQMVVVPSAWGSLLDDFRLLSILRAALPDTRLVIYGPNITADPGRVLRDSVADLVILGEPEESALRLGEGWALGDVPNIAYLENDKIIITDRRPPPDWASYPLPARDLLDLSLYTIPFSRRLPSTTIATVRGCIKNCTFCPTQIWNTREVRARPVELVLEEIDELVGRYGMKEIVFRDDTFTWDRQRVIDICMGMIARGYDLTWRVFATVDTVDTDLLNLMATAGCVQICYGFESGDDQVLRKTGKGTTVAQGHDAVRATKAAGIEISGTFIVGLEGDTPETIQKSIDFAKHSDLDYVQVNVAVPMPTTGFGKRHKRQGLESNPDAFRWSGAETGETKDVAADALPNHARRFYREFYLRPQYIARRLVSRRGLKSLMSHASLGAKMALYTAEPYLPWK
ncbi:MAG: anaerobic magnesium-protoporphyrin IX monomethyl ester cyclase [Myxococcota bacterium]